MELQAHKEYKEYKVHREQTVLLDRKGLKDQSDCRVQQDRKEYKVQREQMVLRALKVHKAYKVLPGNLD